jgi:hypothetical protein
LEVLDWERVPSLRRPLQKVPVVEQEEPR